MQHVPGTEVHPRHAAFLSAYNFDNINSIMGNLPVQSQEYANLGQWHAKTGDVLIELQSPF